MRTKLISAGDFSAERNAQVNQSAILKSRVDLRTLHACEFLKGFQEPIWEKSSDKEKFFCIVQIQRPDNIGGDIFPFELFIPERSI